MNGKPRMAATRHHSNRRHKMRGRTVAMATVATCLIASAPAGAADPSNLAANGGFESPDIPTGTWSNFASIPGWTATNSCGIEMQDHVAGTPYEGGQFVELNSNCRSGISQILEIPTHRRYTLSFAFSARPGTRADDNKVNVCWNGKPVGTVGPQRGASDTIWSQHAVTVDPMPGATYYSPTSTNTLMFDSVGANPSGGGVGVYLDDVSLVVRPRWYDMYEDDRAPPYQPQSC
jgi:hypothetical protein